MTPSSALAGITVLEICNVAAGPFCGMLLADMGADVIKVENPDGGDTLRSWPPISDGYSENFASLNRNKRSVTLNLKDPGDLELARELALTVDVLIENNRPGVMDRLGLGYEALKARNPRLVYCSISAYGQSGPRAQEGGFDLTIQAMSGIMSVTGEAGGEPVKCGVPLADFSAGLYGAFAIASALRAAQASGQGAHIDAHAGRHAGHRRAADLRVLRQRARSGQARLRPSAQRALPGVPLQGRVLRHGRRQPGAVEERVRGGWPR